MLIREATEEDLPFIAHAGRDFMVDSGWIQNLTLSNENIYSTLLFMVKDPNTVIVAAYEDNGDVAGFTMWHLENPWTVEKIAVEILFYIRPASRNMNIAKELLKSAIELCKHEDARLFYSASTASFNDGGRNARAFNALLRRQGFKEIPESKFLLMKTKELGNE
ncbi:GNAT family N-acetyltransferase [Candidatus Pacearchaeota archaeon]|nr:GNAT family N-acetyltransferase [Candidatus Pacearchaeota archaeon]